jgi:hypothetical protein
VRTGALPSLPLPTLPAVPTKLPSLPTAVPTTPPSLPVVSKLPLCIDLQPGQLPKIGLNCRTS